MAGLLDKAKMPVGREKKKQLDAWLNENVNLPLAEKGYENIGAGLSAAISSAGELLIPDNLAEAALALVPGATLLKAGKKGMKALKIADKARKPIGRTLDYGEIARKEQKAKRLGEEAAETLDYSDYMKGPVRKKPDLTDTQLRQQERDRLKRTALRAAKRKQQSEEQ